MVLQFTWKVPFGTPGEDSDPENPAARALRGLLLDGKPVLDFRNIILVPHADTTTPALWLGAVVHTVARRILFFPAIKFDGFTARHRGTARADQGFPVDHITLNSDHRGWHFTSAGSRKRFAGPNTHPIGSNIFLWFGMNIRGPEALRPLKQSTVVTAEIPDSDADRRSTLLSRIREDADDWAISLHQQAFDRPEPWFVHVGIFVGPRGFALPADYPLGLPDAAAYDTPDTTASPKLPARAHFNQLKHDVDLCIVTAAAPGTLRDPIGFAGFG